MLDFIIVLFDVVTLFTLSLTLVLFPNLHGCINACVCPCLLFEDVENIRFCSVKSSLLSFYTLLLLLMVSLMFEMLFLRRENLKVNVHLVWCKSHKYQFHHKSINVRRWNCFYMRLSALHQCHSTFIFGGFSRFSYFFSCILFGQVFQMAGDEQWEVSLSIIINNVARYKFR